MEYFGLNDAAVGYLWNMFALMKELLMELVEATLPVEKCLEYDELNLLEPLCGERAPCSG